jgi:hypothetical protein
MTGSERITDCADPDPRVRLAQLAEHASLLAELDRLTEELAARQLGEPYAGPGTRTVAGQEAARKLSELAGLHKDDDLTDHGVVADLHISLASAVALVKVLQEDHGGRGRDQAQGSPRATRSRFPR